MELKQDEVKTLGGNVFRKLREQAGCQELECTHFAGIEDLGDGIYVGRLGQKLWVANYFARHFKGPGEHFKSEEL